MSSPQAGIFALGTRAHYYLEFDLEPNIDPRNLVRLLASQREPRQATGGVNLVVGLSPTLWRYVAPEDCPASAADFQSVTGPDGFEMPASQHDAWVWISGASPDVVFDAAIAMVACLKGVATLGDDSAGFTYHDSRDLTGFIDGSANPSLDEAIDAATVPDGEPGARASVVIVQRWIHDLDSFHAQSVEDQERVFGRTKEYGVEFSDEDMPENAHIARVEIHDDQGDDLEIFRRSTPIGDLRGHGLEFVGFACDQAILATMLNNMVGNGDGIRDRLTHFTTPVTGAFYVTPSVEALRQFASDDTQ